MEKKIVKDFVYMGFGFPVTLKSVTLFKSGGEWSPRIDLEKIGLRVFRDLAKRGGPYTGYEIFFIRAFLKLSKVDFGKKIGVSHAAVLGWEKKRDTVAPLQKGNLATLEELVKKHAGIKEKKKTTKIIK